MRISDWSSDVCSSDLGWRCGRVRHGGDGQPLSRKAVEPGKCEFAGEQRVACQIENAARLDVVIHLLSRFAAAGLARIGGDESEDRKSVVWGKSVSVRVDRGGGGSMKNKSKRHI